MVCHRPRRMRWTGRTRICGHGSGTIAGSLQVEQRDTPKLMGISLAARIHREKGKWGYMRERERGRG